MANPNHRTHMSEDDPANPPVSPWSCFPCRRRKIRCDRRYPCSHCLKGDLVCGFPVSGRTPTRRHDLPSFTSRKEKQDDLLGRLRRLEGFVAKLGTELDSGHRGGEASSREGSRAQDFEMRLDGEPQNRRQKTDMDIAHVTRELGTLVTHDNESIYVGNWLWGVICDEVKHIRQAVEDSEIESESLEKRILSPSIQGVPFFWRPESASSDISQPLPSQVSYIWEIFVENIDPFIKILHVPSISKAIREAKGKFNLMARGMEALMFAISLAAVTSLREDEVEENFGEDRQKILTRLRLGTEQALSRAGVLNTTDISTVQAFIIYLEIVKQNDGQRATWTLAGLLIRIAFGMGLHRDGSHFSNVSVFDAEIRRRVWYHICLLDWHVGDCQVFNVGITESLFDTKQPSNLNDADITPDMASLPESKDQYTDCTFCILRCKMWHFARGFRPSISIEPSSNKANAAHQLELLTEIRKSMAKDLEQYLQPTENPLHLLIQTAVALEISRYDQVIHVANSFQSSREESRPHRAFALAITSLHHVFLLAEQPSTSQWSWYLYSCIQWHTMSTVLVSLSTSPWGPVSERAWDLSKKAFAQLSEGTYRDPMRQPLPDLMGAVARHRQLQIQRLRANPAWTRRLAEIGAMPVPMSPIRNFSDGLEVFDTSIAEERLSLEMSIADSQSKNPEVTSSRLVLAPGGSATADMWIDMTPSFIGTDDTDEIFLGPHSTQGYEGSRQNPVLSSAGNQYENIQHSQDPWESGTYSYTFRGDEGAGWLDWDEIVRTEGIP
ncbi:hypothetical protein GGR51DRAFT_576269 [Nemania sp. FL0031]|nr:hypothetical protein GGR51DRAFT_576269 [Nemania sp. FL0031]